MTNSQITYHHRQSGFIGNETVIFCDIGDNGDTIFMISEALVFLKNQLNNDFKAGIKLEDNNPDPVIFIDGESIEPLIFKLGFVSTMLIKLEDENLIRAPDLYRRTAANGEQRRVQPEIRLNLYVLFVARFKEYEESLRNLSRIIRYFQNHRVFDHQNAPELNEGIDQLVAELITLPFAEQNEVWNALRTTYQPSLLYKVKMVVFRDEETMPMTAINRLEIDLRGAQ